MRRNTSKNLKCVLRGDVPEPNVQQDISFLSSYLAVDVLLEDVLLWQQWNCFENYPKTISRVVQKNANFSGHNKTGIF